VLDEAFLLKTKVVLIAVVDLARREHAFNLARLRTAA
jgi:hypothetical protein